MIRKESIQVQTEEVFEELRLNGWRFIETAKQLDSYCFRLSLRNSHNEKIILRVQLDGPDCSWSGTKKKILQAMFKFAPSILDNLN